MSPTAPSSSGRVPESPPPPAGVTVIAVPRERFSVTRRALESLCGEMAPGFRLVYVDGGSPPAVARYLAEQSKARGFELVRTERFLAPNEARNLGLRHAGAGRYVVFVENDVLLAPGCLATLVRCAEETGADLVGPVYGEGEPERGFIHMAGGTAGIREEEGARRLTATRRFSGRRIAEIEGELKREPTELLEFHCLLARLSTLQALGPLDERLLCTAEEIDLCFAVRDRGGAIYLEPAARVTYVTPPPLDRSDYAFFQLRWSETWTRTTFARMREKWNLADRDPYFPEHVRWIRSHRRLALQRVQERIRRALGRLARWPLLALAFFEVVANGMLIRDRERLSRLS
jgi:GT2 family glycosyltransferase